jgi:hypothetical protein
MTVAANVIRYQLYDLYFACNVLFAVRYKSVIIFYGTANFWDCFKFYIYIHYFNYLMFILALFCVKYIFSHSLFLTELYIQF